MPLAIAPYQDANQVVGVGPTDFNLFVPPKKHLAGKRFQQTPT
jgi:hypothetical protein